MSHISELADWLCQLRVLERAQTLPRRCAHCSCKSARIKWLMVRVSVLCEWLILTMAQTCANKGDVLILWYHWGFLCACVWTNCFDFFLKGTCSRDRRARLAGRGEEICCQGKMHAWSKNDLFAKFPRHWFYNMYILYHASFHDLCIIQKAMSIYWNGSNRFDFWPKPCSMVASSCMHFGVIFFGWRQAKAIWVLWRKAQADVRWVFLGSQIQPDNGNKRNRTGDTFSLFRRAPWSSTWSISTGGTGCQYEWMLGNTRNYSVVEWSFFWFVQMFDSNQHKWATQKNQYSVIWCHLKHSQLPEVSFTTWARTTAYPSVTLVVCQVLMKGQDSSQARGRQRKVSGFQRSLMDGNG